MNRQIIDSTHLCIIEPTGVELNSIERRLFCSGHEGRVVHGVKLETITVGVNLMLCWSFMGTEVPEVYTFILPGPYIVCIAIMAVGEPNEVKFEQ